MPDDLRDHPVARVRAAQVSRCHRTAQLQAPVRGVYPRAAALHLHGAEEGGDTALQYLLQHTRPAVGCIARHLHADAIAMHDAAHFRRRQKHALFKARDAHEAITGAVGAHRAFDYRARLNLRVLRARL